MLNHFYFKQTGDDYLITNDLGYYCFLSGEDFHLFVKDGITKEHPKYDVLYNRFFLYHEHKDVFLSRISEAMRKSKSHLLVPTTLFIFVVTDFCNADCIYCQAKHGNAKCHGSMSLDTAEKAVDIVMTSPTSHITFEFQGGEPLLNFEVIRHIVEYAEKCNEEYGKQIEFTIVSNLSLLTYEIISFFKEHHFAVSTSLDGNRTVHNKNRPLKDGSDSFQVVINQYKKLTDAGIPVGAIETTTKHSLPFPKETIDTYLDLDLNSVFIRPLTPLGIAKENWNKIGYTPEEFLSFYKAALLYLIDINKKTGKIITEGHARIFLQKILCNSSLNYMELRSPCGATIGQMAFYYDGNIYTCDEGRMLSEMGDDAFRIGNVNNTYEQLTDSPVCKSTCAASVLECLPECCDCVFSPYCGTCPVINYALDGDIFPRYPKNYRCKIYSGMLQILFDILHTSNDEVIHVFESWM